MISQSYKLNLIPNNVPVIVKASQYDKESRTINFTLLNGDVEYTIPTGSTVTVQGTKPDKTGYQYSCSFSSSVVSFDIQQQMTVISGKHQAEIRIVKDGDILGTANFVFDIEKAGLSDDTVISETELPLIEEVVDNIEDIEIISDNIADVQTVADNIQDVSTVADNIADVQNAEENALKSEGYALGTQNGTPVTSGEYYHNNSKYYMEQAVSINPFSVEDGMLVVAFEK